MAAKKAEPTIVVDGKEYSDFLIGSDPELKFEGITACKVVPFTDAFGTDGPNSKIGELRPDACANPLQHVQNIENLLKYGYKKYPQLQKKAWLGGSLQENSPLGGHIHFGSSCDEYLELKLIALDKLLAPTVMMLENEESAKQRRQGSEYGKLASHNGTFDEKNRGFKTKRNSSKPLNHPGFEYRPLSSWLVSKNMAAGIFSLGKVITFQTHNKSLHDKIWPSLKFIDNNKKFYSSFYSCDKRYFSALMPSIFRIVKKLKLYPYYANYINYLFDTINQGKDWQDGKDLKNRWNIISKIQKTIKEKNSYSLKEIFAANLESLTAPKKKKIWTMDDEDDFEEDFV